MNEPPLNYSPHTGKYYGCTNLLASRSYPWLVVAIVQIVFPRKLCTKIRQVVNINAVAVVDAVIVVQVIVLR